MTAEKSSQAALRSKRPIRIEGDVAYVPLTRGYEALIDAADVHLVSTWNWYAYQDRHTLYARRTDRSGGPSVTVPMHRHLMGSPDGLEISHRNGNGLDNRRSTNLRITTHAESQRNQRIRTDSSSRLKGVHWDAARGQWCSQITLDGKTCTLGRYDTPEDAHAAYCRASAEMHGEFGRVA